MPIFIHGARDRAGLFSLRCRTMAERTESGLESNVPPDRFDIFVCRSVYQKNASKCGRKLPPK